MSRVTLIQHINIQISNRERTREWYEQVLGAEFLDRGPELNKRQLQLRELALPSCPILLGVKIKT